MGSRANSTREVPRWRREGYQSRTKKVHWSSGVRDTREKTPESNSSAMVNRKKRDSISSHSGGSYKSHRRSGVEAPSKLQKINETSKVRFLTAEEVIKQAFCIEAPTSSHVDFPTERDYLSSSRGSPIVDKAHAPKSSALAKIATPVASDSRQSSSSNQHQAFWRSESTENEEAPPGVSVKNSTVGGTSIPRPKGAENNPRKQLFSDGQDERDSRLVCSGISSESGPDFALKDVPPRNTMHVFRKRRFQEHKFSGTEVSLSRMDTEHEDSGLDAALSEELDSSCKKHEGSGTEAVMPEKLVGPNRRMNLVNDPAGVKFKAGPSSDCNIGQERNLQRNLPNSLKYPQKGPALKFIWKGNFEVLDIESDVRRYEGILAHPSAKIARKAYGLTKQIAGALQFVMHPRHDFWPAMFQTDCPDRNDIALYFYPGKHERSKRQYSFLLKLIEKEDMVLRSCIGDVQLLVYPSKLLQADLQKLDGSYFMWGVFCGPKGSKVVFKAGALPSSSTTVA